MSAPNARQSQGSSMSVITSRSTNGAGNISAAFLEPEEGMILEVPNLRIFTFAELKAATRNFKPDTVLGEGGFGRVYKGWVDKKTMNPMSSSVGSAMVIAVKKLKPGSSQGLEEWQCEVNFLGRMSHPNLVRLLGYCLEERELLLVYEFMAKGSLENHLFRSESPAEKAAPSIQSHGPYGYGSPSAPHAASPSCTRRTSMSSTETSSLPTSSSTRTTMPRYPTSASSGTARPTATAMSPPASWALTATLHQSTFPQVTCT
uniref:non-specific serine/threonine protein kinase n=1 Tax=Aegilops tauschii subsp. strangulata TaxID=200361 RepID=A0A453ABT5_AEGTS